MPLSRKLTRMTQATDIATRPTMRHPGVAIGLCWLLAGVYALLAAWAALWLSPRMPYADTWRFDAQLLSNDFLQAVFMADNGHIQVPSRLLRALELGLRHGSQWPTLVIGLAALGICIVVWSTTPRPSRRGELTFQRQPGFALARAAWILTGVVGLCWLGNARTLAHGNEALHSYLIIACLLGALRLVATPGRRRLALALVLALLASLSFGTGAAVFAAIAVVLVLRRANGGALVATIATAGLAGALYWWLVGGSGAARVIDLQPALQLQQLARWLATPWLLAGGPLVDASLLPYLPAPLRQVAAPLAHLSVHWFGPARTAVWPELGLGLAGLACLLALTWLARFRPTRQQRSELVALGTAWFALTCALLVVAARSDYFVQHPEQIYASRYSVWISLFWCGLLGATLWRLHAAARHRMAIWLPMVVALALLPSSAWMGMRAAHMSRIAARDAAALRLGIIDRDSEHGESPVEAMVRAWPLMQSAGVAMFAPDTGPRPGTTVAATDGVTRLQRVRWQPLDNVLPGPASRVRFRYHAHGAERLLLLDARQRVIGIALPVPGDGPWRGWVRGSPMPLYVARP